MKFMVTSRKGAAAAVAFLLASPVVAVTGIGGGVAQASSDAFSLYAQTANPRVQSPIAQGSKTIAMTVSPVSGAPGNPIEIQVTGTLPIGTGPASPVDPGTYELDAVVHLDGVDYVLRGSKTGQTVNPCTDPNPCTTNSLFKSGWVISSTPGSSSSSSISDGTTVAGTAGIGATIRGSEGTAVALVAPSSTGSYSIGLKALAANGLFNPPSGTGTEQIQYNQPSAGKNQYDVIINTSQGSGWNNPCSFNCTGTDGPAQTLQANTASFNGTESGKGNIIFSTPVTLTVAAPTAPVAPAKPVATAGNAEATVTWTAPANGGSAITEYKVTSVTPDASKTCTPLPATALTCTFTGLTNGTPYTFEVTAKNLIGTSAPSPASDSVTPSAPTAPAAPAAPTVVAGDGSLDVSWVAPDDGGSAITGYTATAAVVTAPASSKGKYQVLVTDPSCTTAMMSCTIDGVTNGTQYVVTVVATNDVGSSNASPSSEPATPTAATPTPTPTPTGPDTAPRSATATLPKIYCQPNNTGLVPIPDEFSNWPVTITVTPGAAAPGSTILIEVSLEGSAINGPASVNDPGQFRFETSVRFNGADVILLGPSNTTQVPFLQPIFTAAELPLVATGTVTLPITEGDFPVTINGFIFNNVQNKEGQKPEFDFFTSKCNAGTSPQTAPKAFTNPKVSITSSNEAPPSTIEPKPTPIDDNGGGTDTSGGTLPKTGGNPISSLWVALILFQIGLIMAVRSVRAAPVKTARHL